MRLKDRIDSRSLDNPKSYDHATYAAFMRWMRRCAKPTDTLLARLLLLTGARLSEALNARWTDVDFGSRIWTIQPHRPGRAARSMPLSNSALRVLRRLAWLQPGAEHLHPRSAKFAHLAFASYAKAAGVRFFTFHSLRVEAIRRFQATRKHFTVHQTSMIFDRPLCPSSTSLVGPVLPWAIARQQAWERKYHLWRVMAARRGRPPLRDAPRPPR